MKKSDDVGRIVGKNPTASEKFVTAADRLISQLS